MCSMTSAIVAAGGAGGGRIEVMGEA